MLCEIGEDLTKASTEDIVVFLEVEYVVNSTAKEGEEHVDEKSNCDLSKKLRPFIL